MGIVNRKIDICYRWNHVNRRNKRRNILRLYNFEIAASTQD